MDGEKTRAITERGRESRTKGEKEKGQGVAFVEQRTLIRVCVCVCVAAEVSTRQGDPSL